MAGFQGLSLSTPFQHYPHSVCLLSQRGWRHFPGITLLAQHLQWTVCGWRYIEWGKEEDREIRQRDREREWGKQGEEGWETGNREQDGDANICWAQSCGTMAWQAGDRFKKGRSSSMAAKTFHWILQSSCLFHWAAQLLSGEHPFFTKRIPDLLCILSPLCVRLTRFLHVSVGFLRFSAFMLYIEHLCESMFQNLELHGSSIYISFEALLSFIFCILSFMWSPCTMWPGSPSVTAYDSRQTWAVYGGIHPQGSNSCLLGSLFSSNLFCLTYNTAFVKHMSPRRVFFFPYGCEAHILNQLCKVNKGKKTLTFTVDLESTGGNGKWSVSFITLFLHHITPFPDHVLSSNLDSDIMSLS